ncbi:MAG: hypothetical protein C0404_09120 [Verrucomicrobia bacterium]|nr:hypothetical protein [Verrucomicrobiota bacterium]
MMPAFFVPGEAKCGTTSFYRYLTKHPCLVAADMKEPATFLKYGASPFFCRMHYPVAWRSVMAALTGRKCLAGEATANYLASEKVAAHISALVPEAKIIIMMRNPVARAFSDHQMMMVGGWETEEFNRGVQLHLRWLGNPELEPLVRQARMSGEGFIRFILRGVYVDNILAWQKYFPKENFLFIKSEEFFAEPQRILNASFSFLGVDEYSLGDFPVHKKGKYDAGMTRETILLLSQFYREHNKRLYAVVGRNLGWESEIEQQLMSPPGGEVV